MAESKKQVLDSNTVELLTAIALHESRGRSRETIAGDLGIELELIAELILEFEEHVGPGTWESLVLEKKTLPAVVDNNYDQMERLATEKLVQRLKVGSIHNVSDLLAIARLSNQATRKGAFPPPAAGSSGGGAIAAGFILPAGEQGVIHLTLTPAAAQSTQDGARIIEHEAHTPGQTAFGSRYEPLANPALLRDIAEKGDTESGDR